MKRLSEDQILWLSLSFLFARGTFHLHGITRNSSWKIKWIMTLHLGRFKKCGGWFEAMQCLCSVFCRGSLQASSLWRSGYTSRVNGIWISPPIPLWAPSQLSCQISANQCDAEMSANVNKHLKTRAKGNYVITNVISTNQHFALTQIFKFQRQWQALLPFPAPPRRVCSQTIVGNHSPTTPGLVVCVNGKHPRCMH